MAFVVVDSENDVNWLWFLKEVSSILAGQDKELTFISNHHHGLIEGAKNVFPNAGHGFCYYHLKQNLRSRICGKGQASLWNEVVNLFLHCMHCADKFKFHQLLAEVIRLGGDKIKDMLREMPLHNWSTFYFRGDSWGDISSGLAESFNN